MKLVRTRRSTLDGLPEPEPCDTRQPPPRALGNAATLRFVRVSEMGRRDWLDRVAELFHDALADYYDRMPLSAEERWAHLRTQIETSGGELSTAIAPIHEGEVVGAYAALPSAESRRRQVADALRLVRATAPSLRSDLKAALRAFRSGVPRAPEDGVYLARIATARTVRRRGVGWQMLEHLCARYATSSIGLHVHESNRPAIALYTRFGFLPVDVRSTYHLMVRTHPGPGGT